MKNRNRIRQSARRYTRWGWRVVPVPHEEKAPRLTDWQKLRLTESDIYEYFDEENNIGILLGKASKGLVDTDLDCGQAIFLAPYFLPETNRVHGRKSKPDSHFWYRVEPIPTPQRFCDVDGACLVELRSTGQQTIAPPSIHPSGERFRWKTTGLAGRVGDVELVAAVKRLAAATLLARHWPKPGSRHHAALALAGTLLRAGWDEIEVSELVTLVAQAAGDDEWVARKAAARTTRKRLDTESKATGRPRLAELLGAAAVDRACEWLGIRVAPLIAVKSPTNTPEWPRPLAESAMYGLAGDVVRMIAPHTEADPAALLVQFLVAFGNVIGRRAHVRVGATRHFANLFCVVVGRTSRARKGTAWEEVARPFEYVDLEWLRSRTPSGLGSGEGVIWCVRDPSEEVKIVTRKGRAVGQKVTKDPGVKDKRLLVMETEFASVLKVIRREGSTLSPVIRRAWDRDDLHIVNKNSPAKATGAHISIVGHITREEVLREISANEGSNGFANRFLWTCATRSQELPFGGSVDVRDLVSLQGRLKKAVAFSRTAEELRFSEKAKAMWSRRYKKLTADVPGLFGAVISRSEAQVLRLSLIYALLDCSSAIKTPHLKAALAFWRYCKDSAHHIFGDAVGNYVADKILAALRKSSKGLSRTEIRSIFSRNRSDNEITQALTVLDGYGLARCQHEETGGRPLERWFAN